MSVEREDEQGEEQERSGDLELIEGWLEDPRKKALMLRKLGLGDDIAGARTLSGKTDGTRDQEPLARQHLTPSGTSAGEALPPFSGWPLAAWGFPPSPALGGASMPPPVHPGFFPPFGYGYGYGHMPNQTQSLVSASMPPVTASMPPATVSMPPMTVSRPSTSSEVESESVYSSTEATRKRALDDDSGDEEDEDRVRLLDEKEALELLEFDPTVDTSGAWEPPKTMVAFLQRHFNRTLKDEEREAINKDFPKPAGGILVAPKLDEQVKEHLRRKGKDPHFGSEKSLYKLQEHVLDVAGPLTCLWADLINKEAKVSTEDTMLLVQRALVLLGSVSHSISQERRKIAWSRINPKLKGLAEEEYDKREANLFGPGFLEKASKRIEVDKTMDKVSFSRKGKTPLKKQRYDNDSSDLRSFLSKGAPGLRGHGTRRPYRRQPCHFQSSKKYLPPQTRQVRDQPLRSSQTKKDQQ